MSKFSVMVDKWKNLDFLRKGGGIQRAAMVAIDDLGIRESFIGLSPFLIGEIALGLPAPTSKITILLATHDLDIADKLIQDRYWKYGARSEKVPIEGSLALRVSFSYDQFTIEFLAQTRCLFKQSAFIKFQELFQQLSA